MNRKFNLKGVWDREKMNQGKARQGRRMKYDSFWVVAVYLYYHYYYLIMLCVERGKERNEVWFSEFLNQVGALLTCELLVLENQGCFP